MDRGRDEKGGGLWRSGVVTTACTCGSIRSGGCGICLWVCTPGENQRNQRKQRGSASQYKGVGDLKNCKRCHAKLVFKGETVWLGHFNSEPEAARAYDREAVEIFGEFANLNFPGEWPEERRAQVRAEAKAAGRSARAKEQTQEGEGQDDNAQEEGALHRRRQERQQGRRTPQVPVTIGS